MDQKNPAADFIHFVRTSSAVKKSQIWIWIQNGSIHGLSKHTQTWTRGRSIMCPSFIEIGPVVSEHSSANAAEEIGTDKNNKITL